MIFVRFCMKNTAQYSIMNTPLDNPFDFVTVQQITNYYYNITQVIPHKEATISIHLFTDNHTEIKVLTKRIVDEEYSNWGNDDNYIDNLVLTEIDNFRKSLDNKN